MNVNEAGILLGKIVAMYPNFKMMSTKASAVVWAETLEHISLEEALKALTLYGREKHEFAPNAGILIDIIVKNKPRLPDGEKAWNRFMVAVRNGTYGYEEEYNELPSIIRRITSPSEIHMLAINGTNEWTKKDFIKSYEAVRREVEYGMLSKLHRQIGTDGVSGTVHQISSTDTSKDAVHVQ